MTEQKALNYGECLAEYIRKIQDIQKAWRTLAPLLPEASGKEAEAVQAMREAMKAEQNALANLVFASLQQMQTMNKLDA